MRCQRARFVSRKDEKRPHVALGANYLAGRADREAERTYNGSQGVQDFIVGSVDLIE
jgi:hypothetical protein